MNHSIIIRTKDDLNLNKILRYIAKEYPNVIFKDDFSEVSFINAGRSSRPVQILKIDDGYEVSLPTLSSEYDFYLVEYVVRLLCEMADVDGYDVLGEKVEDCDDFFIPQNFELRREDDVRFIKDALKTSGSFIELPCDLCNIFVGFDFLRRAGVSVTSDDERFHGRLTAAMAQVLVMLMLRSHNDDDMEIHSNDNPDQSMSLSCYRYPDDNNIDYLAFGELLTLEDARSKSHVEILYNDFKKIVPDGWTLIDEVQYKVVPFTDQSWDELFNKAKEFQWDGSFEKKTQNVMTDSESNPMFNQPKLIGSSFGYDYHDGSHQDFGYSKEDVDLLLEFGKAIESGTSDYYNQAFLECDLGILYEKGIGVEQDCHKAVYWYEKSAADGDEYARCNLADILRKGTGGVEIDWKRAFEIYKTVKHPYGPFRVGYMYEHGMGVEKDMKKAIKWYKKGHRHFLAAKRLRELGIDPEKD